MSDAPVSYIPAILRPLWREAVERSIRTYLETEGICWVESAPRTDEIPE